MINISFSWDDGSIYDVKLAKLMTKYGINAIFFIPNENWQHSFIKADIIKEIYDMGMEIGGHTVSHKYLTSINRNKIENEIKDNKEYLEDIVQKDIDIFCYPGGYYNKYIENIVKMYYKKARSAKTMRFSIQNKFTIDTSFHFYDRGIMSILKNTMQNDRKEIITVLKAIKDNDTFNIYKNILFFLCNKDDNYNIHIWGHGWEIENYNLWTKLEDFIKALKDNNFIIKSMSDIYL